MKILFSMRHVGSFRLYDSVLRRLAARGHDVDVVVNRRDSVDWSGPAAQLSAEHPSIRWHWADDLTPTPWLEFATIVRLWLDYLRYFEPRYRQAQKLRVRAEDRVPQAIVRISRAWPWRTGAGRRCLARLLRASERALPRHAAADALIRDHVPDAVLVTPLLHLGSPQIEVFRSARAASVPTALCVGSWDHLSSKSVIRDAPDRVLVWNATQRQEAVELHGLDAGRVVITGAQCYDHWFDRRPRCSRTEFCLRAGLPDDRPFILWVCSALFPGSPVEATFVLGWVDHLRRSADKRLASAGILIRPHPARLEEWADADLSRWPAVALRGSLPIDEESRDDYFEALHYAAAVAGLNTSAFVEAAIVGRPVHTVLLPEYHDNQEGTIHFHYLLPEQGGPLIVARDLDTHFRQLSASLAGLVDSHRNEAFVSRFVRPSGVMTPAGDIFADAVEALGRLRPAPAATPMWAPLMRVVLQPVVAATGLLLRRAGDDRTSRELRRMREKTAYRQDKTAAAERQAGERERRHREKEAEATRARDVLLRERDAQRTGAEREKARSKRERERQKQRHERMKRRAAFRDRVKRSLGLAG